MIILQNSTYLNMFIILKTLKKPISKGSFPKKIRKTETMWTITFLTKKFTNKPNLIWYVPRARLTFFPCCTFCESHISSRFFFSSSVLLFQTCTHTHPEQHLTAWGLISNAPAIYPKLHRHTYTRTQLQLMCGRGYWLWQFGKYLFWFSYAWKMNGLPPPLADVRWARVRTRMWTRTQGRGVRCRRDGHGGGVRTP